VEARKDNEGARKERRGKRTKREREVAREMKRRKAR